MNRGGGRQFNDMEYQFVFRDDIGSQARENDLTPDVVYRHFLNYTDECIYVVEGETLVGLITPGDLHRFYTTDGDTGYINRTFTYIEEIDFNKAREVFTRIQTIHEVPVIKEHIFLGIIESGEQKSDEEWIKIRNGFLPYYLGKMEWKKEEIWDIVKHVQANVYVYFRPDEEKLKWENSDWTLYNEKNRRPNGAVGLEKMSECEKKMFFGSNYGGKYVEEFIKEFRMLRAETYNGISKIRDISGQYFNVSDGRRKVHGVSKFKGGNKRRIYCIGPCIIFGAYVSDKQTIESYLQEMLNRLAPDEYEVLNCGMMTPVHFPRLLTEEFTKDDTIIYYDDACDSLLWKKASLSFKNVKLGSELAEAYNGIANPAGNMFNSLWHCNHVINERIANIIYRDIEAELSIQINSSKAGNGEKARRIAMQDYYIPWDIIQYYRQYIEEHGISSLISDKVGAIVMNCNPFTKGHRYLVENASSQVDRLFVFVVEEDQSDFAFSDRFHMVKLGVSDLDNVYVLPSGKYIISQETFSQYFEKDSVTQVENMDYDLHIFGDVIAKEFGIKVRFVGEEPFDVVTRKYNETMKNLLPQKGVEVIEIPRLKDDEGTTISASRVRKYLQENKIKELEKLVPASTMKILGFTK